MSQSDKPDAPGAGVDPTQGPSLEAKAGTPPPQPQHTVSDIFGQIVWLMSQSPAHRSFFISDLEWMVMPPLLLRQFRIFPGKNQPLGVAMYAKLSEEAEARLQQPNGRLSPQEWNSGDRLWLVELLAPFGHHETMLEDLKNTVFSGKTFKMHTVGPEGRKVVTIGPEQSANAPTAPTTH